MSLDRLDLPYRWLEFYRAFHSYLIDDAAKTLSKVAATLEFREPAIPYLSSYLGTWIGKDYRIPVYQAELARRGITQSMSRKGNCFDNAVMESFFGTLKAECFHLNEFADIDALRAGLKEYIDYYNRQCIKVKLGGLSPLDYRMRAGAC